MKLVENVHYEVAPIRAGTWARINGDWLYCCADADGKLQLARITDLDVSRQDIQAHFQKITTERKAKARNRKSIAERRKTA